MKIVQRQKGLLVYMKFKSVSIILPTLKETDTFVTAIRMILEMNPGDIGEFIAVVCDRTKPESFQSIEEGGKIAEEAGVPLRVLYQTLPGFGGAIRDGFMAATSSHVCMVTPDLDTAPERLPDLIAEAKKYPNDIILASRWKIRNGFNNYNFVKKIWNYCSQKFLDILYLTNISDFTWGNQVAPTKIYKAINFREVKHPINIERVVIPLRLGIRFHEIGAACVVPEDVTTVNPLWANILYLRPAFYWRFAKKQKLLKPEISYEEFINDLDSEETT